MKRFLIGLLGVLFGSLILTFFVLYNTRYYFLKENEVKTVLEEVNFYDVAATYIKSEIVASSGYSLADGQNFEKLNSEINADSVKPVVDQAVDNIYDAFESKSPNLFIPVNFDSANFHLHKTIDLADNNFYYFLKYLLPMSFISLGLAALFLVIALLLESGVNKKFRLVGSNFLSIGVFLVIGSVVYLVLSPNFYSYLVDRASFFQEPKLVNGLRRAVALIFDREVRVFLIEGGLLAIAGLISFYLSKFFVQEKLGNIDQKF